jgi:translation initiation factor IF-2
VRNVPTPANLTEEMKMALSAGSALATEKGAQKVKQADWSSGKKKKKKKRNNEGEEKIRDLRVQVSQVQLPEQELGIIMLSEGVTVKELAEKINRTSKDVIKRLFERGIMSTINHVLDSELAIALAKDFGYLAEIVTFEEDLQIRDTEEAAMESAGEETTPRAPIVTVMGHVDHGKTSLLDAIRKTKVAVGEAGGITQHIGAYAVESNGRPIVFLDTPGHEAFTKMRARGAGVTDVVVLVVAADDGVKPQTVEAIHHAKAAKVPIIIAINKIDKPDANPDKVKLMLTEHQLVVEDYGGDSPCVLVSAKSGVGIQELLEMVLLVTEIQDLKACPTRKARGTVIEATLDRGRGAVATILVQDGSLEVGEYFIAGATYGKVRAMLDDLGRAIQKAGPSTPVEILGLQEVPMAGDTFQVVADEATARQISSFRSQKQREEALRRRKHMSLDQLFSKMSKGEVKELALIIKSDVQGSLEGIVHALAQIQSEKVTLRILHQGVGNINENDVLLAMASDAIIIGFHVKAERKAQDLAERESIDIRFHSIIYEIVSEIEQGMLGLLEPVYEQVDIGKVQIRQIFSIPKQGKVAGCYVESGLVKKGSKARLLRGGEKVHEGEISGLRRFKDSVNEVKAGYECGLSLAGFEDYQEGDLLEIYELKELKPEL